MANHSPLAGLGPMMSPWRKREVRDTASQMQPKRLSMGDTPMSPTASSPDREAPDRKKRVEATTPTRKTTLTTINFHGRQGNSLRPTGTPSWWSSGRSR